MLISQQGLILSLTPRRLYAWGESLEREMPWVYWTFNIRRRKIDWHLMPLMCSKSKRVVYERLGTSDITFSISFVPVRQHCSNLKYDRSWDFIAEWPLQTKRHWVNQQSLVSCKPRTAFTCNLALISKSPGAHLSQTEFNWLGTVFYLAYLVFEYPQNLALQYFPVGKWMRQVIFEISYPIILIILTVLTYWSGRSPCAPIRHVTPLVAFSHAVLSWEYAKVL